MSNYSKQHTTRKRKIVLHQLAKQALLFFVNKTPNKHPEKHTSRHFALQ